MHRNSSTSSFPILSIHISYNSKYIGLFLFYAVVTAENMSGAAMYELVSRNLSESRALHNASNVKLCQYLY